MRAENKNSSAWYQTYSVLRGLAGTRILASWFERLKLLIVVLYRSSYVGSNCKLHFNLMDVIDDVLRSIFGNSVLPRWSINYRTLLALVWLLSHKMFRC
jgi:hypothetical protein